MLERNVFWLFLPPPRPASELHWQKGRLFPGTLTQDDFIAYGHSEVDTLWAVE